MTDAVQGPWGQRSTAGAVAAAETAASGRVPIMPRAPGSQSGEPVRIGFSGLAGELFGLLVKGFFLQLITLGIYRFWLTTDIRRFYWSHTSVGTEAFAYTGTGMQLLKGFLFALAILVPLQAAGFFLALGLPQAQWVVSIGLTFILLFLGQYAVYASRRYRLTRSSWRGLRLRMTGSAWRYAAKGFGLFVLVILSLGIAYPWAAAVLERIKMRETFYGDAPGDFTGTPGELLRGLAVVWAIGFGLPLILIGATVASIPWDIWANVLRGVLADQYIPTGSEGLAIGAVITALSSSIFIPILLYPAFQAVTFRWRMNGTRIGGAALVSDFRIGSAYRVYALGALAMAGLGIVASIFVGVAAGGLFFASMAGGGGRAGGVLILVLIVFGYLILLGGFWIAKQLLIGLPLYRAKMASLSVTNLASLDSVRARNVEASAMGEGLGDAVDFGIGL
ncbi:DUF898 family protein [Phreatobacter stygius]|uniref:DUF898 domain-containing protein n=1 Tax=Phreatobacter stygius TaxID=1940610 RepID=A0A4D7B5G6_9HYPH|nr:DUF898 family protein [Phreatobacter stygius]QCI66223.1 DUF898 domain-containing protein [Phreatobacter stygius]